MKDFVANVKMIEIEVFSYCNRKCYFCPNSFIDRKSRNIHMGKTLYLKILNELSQAGFSGKVSFSRYNEPLADEIIFERIAQAREALPHAMLHTNTNSDFISRDVVDRLAKAGLDSLSMQIYLSRNQRLADEKTQKQFAALIEKTGLSYEMKIDTRTQRKIVFTNSPIPFMTLRCIDFEKVGNSRGNLLKNIGSAEYVRFSPCSHPFDSMYIDYNGKAMPCCNLRSDSEEHKGYMVGDANEQTVFEIYSGKKLAAWRRSLGGTGRKAEPCTHCNHRDGGLWQKMKNMVYAAGILKS